MSVRVGFVGTGGIAGVHMKILSQLDSVELISFCDIDAKKVQKRARKYGAVPYTDVQQMFANESLDAVYICVPPFAHGQLEEAAAAHNIAIFSEKPVALDMDSARQKAQAIAKAGVINASGYCLRYMDTVDQAKLFQDGRTIALANGYYFGKLVTIPWFRDMNKSGGQLVEQATHCLDLILYFLGPVESVHANMALTVLEDKDHMTIPDVTSVNLKLSSGSIAHLGATLIQSDLRAGVEFMGKDFRFDLSVNELTTVQNNETRIIKNRVNYYKAQSEAFIRAVQENDQSLIRASFEDGVRTLEVSLAANESARTGQVITLSSSD